MFQKMMEDGNYKTAYKTTVTAICIRFSCIFIWSSLQKPMICWYVTAFSMQTGHIAPEE